MLDSLRNPHQVGKFKLLTSRGQFCPTQSESLNFLTGWDIFVPPTLVWEFKLPYLVGQFLPLQKRFLAITKDKMTSPWSESAMIKCGKVVGVKHFVTQFKFCVH